MSYIGLDSPAAVGILPVFIGGILGVLGLYCTGNVVSGRAKKPPVEEIE